MNLDDLTAQAHEVPAARALEAPPLMLEADDDVGAVVQFFGDEGDRDVVKLVVRGAEVGYLERKDVLSWFKPRSMGYGDSGRATLPGHSPATSWELIMLECPVPGCPASPMFAARFDPERPPHCPEHPKQDLRVAL